MFKRILVALDGSPLSESALAPATILAQRFNAHLILLVRATNQPIFSRLSPPNDLAAMTKAEAYLTGIAQRLVHEGITVQIGFPDDPPALMIPAEAETRQSDLIVMATHRRTSLAELLHPSITWHVLRQTATPILTWREARKDGTLPKPPQIPRFLDDPTSPMIVPLDGSLLAETALPLAQELARVLGNPLLLVRAADQPFIASSAIDYQAIIAQAEEWALAEARSYLERKRLELVSTGQRATIESYLGTPGAVIEDCVQEHQAGLVVMASHGRGGLGRMLLGSVAKHLLSHLEIPILLARFPASQPTETASA